MDMAKVIANIASKVPVNGDVYKGADGLLYCAKCNTPRQSRINVCGQQATVNCLCKCMADEWDKKETERKRSERMAKVMSNRVAGFPDRELMQCTFAADDRARPELSRAMRRYVEHFPEFRRDGKGLLLYGDVGTGKTFLAACVVNALIERGYPCLMTNFPRLANQLSGMWAGKQEYIDSLSEFALVAIDDLGVERDSEYMSENVANIIDSLYRANVPLIITTNYTPKQLMETTDMRKRRIFDRMLERCHAIKVDGASRRKQKGRGDFRPMNEILGL